ncbi:MAG: hypothetical protein NZ455_13115 [Bacteroidia bacterium]|nr:hypothetical protein [Bacteroidia bacterium]MDW8347063.1 hypothetical protein [Bacteroidia bacterium]
MRSVSAAPQRTRSAECTDPSAARDTPKNKPNMHIIYLYFFVLYFDKFKV